MTEIICLLIKLQKDAAAINKLQFWSESRVSKSDPEPRDLHVTFNSMLDLDFVCAALTRWCSAGSKQKCNKWGKQIRQHNLCLTIKSLAFYSLISSKTCCKSSARKMKRHEKMSDSCAERGDRWRGELLTSAHGTKPFVPLIVAPVCWDSSDFLTHTTVILQIPNPTPLTPRPSASR